MIERYLGKFNNSKIRKTFIFFHMGVKCTEYKLTKLILNFSIMARYIESIAFLRISAEWDIDLSSSSERGLSMILFIPESDTTHGTLRQTSVIPKSDSTRVDTDKIESWLRNIAPVILTRANPTAN